MPKKKYPPSLPLFPKRTIPKMPAGYYTSGPNPNLRRFVEEHATPYDPATDKYKVKPFDQPITTTKATAIYNMHTYWSKKPHDAIRQYVRHYTQPGDLVLDPFCGSGGTALAALMEGRAAIAIDLSPAATFITKNYCTPVDVDELQCAFEELQRKVKPEMDWLYETRCDRCDGQASTAYIVFSQTYECPRCLEKIPLYDCQEISVEEKGKEKRINVCPLCYQQGHHEKISTQSKKYGAIPVLVVYDCQEGCTPARSERYYKDKDPKKRCYFQQFDIAKINNISEKPLPIWIPENDIRGVGTRYKKDGLHILGLETVADLYTKRNLWALALLRASIRKDEPLAAVVTSTSLSASKLYRHRTTGGGGPKGTDYYIAPVNREMNVWELFQKRYSNFYDCYPLPIKETSIQISTQSATDFTDIPSNSIDYIFTDPPYSGTIQYGELNYVWESWLGFDTNWKKDEITVNEFLSKTETDWAESIRKSMSECFRVLKPGRPLSLCYHDTSEGTWQLIQDIMAEVGFIPEHSDLPLYIDTGGKTYNQSTADKSTKRDLLINFRKPQPGELTGQLAFFDASDFGSFQETARAVLIEALTNHPGSTTDRLYDELVSRLVRKGQFERHDFDELLRSVAEPVREVKMANLFEEEQPNLFGTHELVRWYLKATVDVVDEAESAKETAAAHRLETFMVRYLAENPEEAGVHYSDLFEQYLPIKDKPRRLLQDWLPEYFFKTASAEGVGTWRPAKDETERAQLAALRSSGLLRRVKRFGNALLEGVPPHERDLPESPATLADWIRQCRRAGLYEIGRAMYEKSGMKFDGLDEVALLELEEDYQVCVRRSEVKPAAKKKAQQVEMLEED